MRERGKVGEAGVAYEGSEVVSCMKESEAGMRGQRKVPVLLKYQIVTFPGLEAWTSGKQHGSPPLILECWTLLEMHTTTNLGRFRGQAGNYSARCNKWPSLAGQQNTSILDHMCASYLLCKEGGRAWACFKGHLRVQQAHPTELAAQLVPGLVVIAAGMHVGKGDVSARAAAAAAVHRGS
eukprot:1139889-Pelagomonas_calceolata.AAC.6